VVLLVDNRRRDLPVAAWIRAHLESRGVECHLQPLEAYRACLARYRPRMIIFNHLTASHLAEYSQRLRRMGVLTAVLPNEGISYDEEDRRYNAGRFHRNAHIDVYFCWNQPAAESLREFHGESAMQIEVIGVPRFDFYFPPASEMFPPVYPDKRDKPRVLFCTNFVLAKFVDLPEEEADRFFAPWKDRIPLCRDYWSAIRAHHQSRDRAMSFLRALLATGRFEVTLRTHPTEDVEYYHQWMKGLPEVERKWLRLENEANITPLILGCDVEISCETCTTALESWIVGKPTIELQLDRHPLFHREEHACCNIGCAEPSLLPAMVEEVLNAPLPDILKERRKQHLAKWCHSASGQSAAQMAEVIVRLLAQSPQPDWSGLTFADHRRAWKLRLTEALGEAYHFEPLLAFKAHLWPSRYGPKQAIYAKSIRPFDVQKESEIFRKILRGADQA
jgi:surface carbohydrate biosynthesis protein